MLVKFFITCNKIGAFTLGGGYAMIPIMEQEFVDKNKWMDKQEFMDIMVVAQLMPIGPGVDWLIATISVNSALVSQWFFTTVSLWMSESIAYPPPKLNVPILVNIRNNFRNSISFL